MHIRLNIKRKFLEFLAERETMIKIMQVEDIQQLQKINAQLNGQNIFVKFLKYF